MSDMKCVKCNSDLERIGDFYACPNPHCTLCGDKDIWQELIRTRKALDVAKERLKNTILDVEILATPEYLASRAKETLDEITALEQKD